LEGWVLKPHHAIIRIYSVNQIIPTTEGVLRVFDRFGKGLFKSTYEILIKDIGRDEFHV
jgi:sulfite reductase (ferredoxin)